MSEGVGRAAGDARDFVHKRIFGGIKGAIGGILGGPGGIIGGAIGGFAGGGGGQSRPPGAFGGFQVPAPLPTVVPAARPGCPPGFVSILGRCVPTGIAPVISTPQAFFAPTGAAPQAPDPFGPAVTGRFGPGLEPEVLAITTRRCPRGAVLGVDGLCYNRRDLRNSERFWPRGRRPLLTGGEMRCISVASAAAKKLQKKQKQLTELGLLKRPPSRSRAAAPVHVRTAAVAHN